MTVLPTREIASKSTPGLVYVMVKTPRGWEHDGALCAWAFEHANDPTAHVCTHVFRATYAEKLEELHPL